MLLLCLDTSSQKRGIEGGRTRSANPCAPTRATPRGDAVRAARLGESEPGERGGLGRGFMPLARSAESRPSENGLTVVAKRP
jgi:hypothetical protein